MLSHDVPQSTVFAHCGLAHVALVQLDVLDRVPMAVLMNSATSNHVVINFDNGQVVDQLLCVALVRDFRGRVVHLGSSVFIPRVFRGLGEGH